MNFYKCGDGSILIMDQAMSCCCEKDLKELISKSVPDPKVELSESELMELLPRWENNGSVKNSRCSIDLSVVRNILEKKFLRK